MRLFVRACVRACLRACVCACLRVCVRACVRVCVRACVRASVCACVCACVRACARACDLMVLSFCVWQYSFKYLLSEQSRQNSRGHTLQLLPCVFSRRAYPLFMLNQLNYLLNNLRNFNVFLVSQVFFIHIRNSHFLQLYTCKLLFIIYFTQYLFNFEFTHPRIVWVVL